MISLNLRQHALPLIGLLATIAGLSSAFVHPRSPGQDARQAAYAASASVSEADLGHIRFRDVGRQSGIDYQWKLPGPNLLNLVHVVGNGCALLDYDNDGALDILLVGPKPALYRGDGHGHFTDVTHATGLDRIKGRFIGCAVGDYDNDGYEDIYLSAFHGGVLLHNEGGKRFTDVTARMGIKPQPFGASAAFVDMDNDGRLDLYICNYVTYDQADGPDRKVERIDKYPPLTGVLYHNEGSRFRDVTREWSIRSNGRALGVTFADFDASGRQSLFVANDMSPNDLVVKRGAHCKNIGMAAGVALGDVNYRGDGLADSGMGADWGDYDNDGRLDLIVATFSDETKNVYHNDGSGAFSNRATDLGLRAPLLPYVSWGVKFADFDNDGWLDLILANGYPGQLPSVPETTEEKFWQRTKVLRNVGGRRFVDAGEGAGPDVNRRIMGRGLAVGDFDNDGRLDVLVVDNDGRPLLLHNETPSVGHWLLCRLVGVKSNRDGYGALLTARVGGRSLLRRCGSDGSYLSASDKRVHFGLGEATTADITVQWPSGRRETFSRLAADRIVTLTEGRGEAAPAAAER